MDAWKNLNSTGYATTDELYTNFGTVKKALENWPAFKVAGFAIYTDASPHAGTALLQDTDYVLEDLDAVKTAEYGEDIYTKVRMINNSTGDIYITYTAIGSYVPADVFQNMLTPYTPTTLNISADNQITDLSVYERGGASEKWNGFEITIKVVGQIAARTYSHLFTGTTYTIGGVAISRWASTRNFIMTLRLDKTNSNWIVVSTNFVNESTSADALALNTTFNFAHGLGFSPSWYEIVLVCTSTDLNYAVGDEIKATPNYTRPGVGEYVNGQCCDATNISYITVNSGFNSAINKTTRGEGALTYAKWKVRARWKNEDVI